MWQNDHFEHTLAVNHNYDRDTNLLVYITSIQYERPPASLLATCNIHTVGLLLPQQRNL